MKNQMLLVRINDEASILSGATVWDLFNLETYDPKRDDFVVLGSIAGKTYKEKKARAHDLAVSVSLFDCSGLSWWEYSELESYFERLAHRFGLVREFKENGII